MTDIKANEREFQGMVVSWLNEFLKSGDYPFEVATQETSIKDDTETTKFPDVSLWIDRKANLSFCTFELKTPITSVKDIKLLEDASEKARNTNADYFVSWNMRDAIIFRTPKKDEPLSYKVHFFKEYDSIQKVLIPDDLWVESKKLILQSRAAEILEDLLILKKAGHLNLVDIDSYYFVHKLREAVQILSPCFRKSLITEVGRNKVFQKDLFDWTVKQGITSFDTDENFYDVLSRQIVYRILGKILFYLTLRRFRSDLPNLDLSIIKSGSIKDKLRECFEIARQIDYQAVFEEDFTDKVPFPEVGIEKLIDLIDDLNRYNFAQMPQDVIGNVFEKLIPTEERHTLGQYFTNENVVDLINAFCIQTSNDSVLDPTCGSGTFLIRAYERFKNLGERDHGRLIPRIWGVDIAHFPAELATINLFRQDLSNKDNFPRIVTDDFFNIKPDTLFKFPPSRAYNNPDQKVEEKIPKFDAIVGNFPYIRQELIEKRIKGYKRKITDTIAEKWLFDDQKLFRMTKRTEQDLQAALANGRNLQPFFENVELNLSGQADIYTYLYFHAARFLKEKGRIGIVTSNSWLDVSYGYELQKFFLRHFKIIAILESRCEPWFEDASVNTTITILEKCEDEESRYNNNVKFVKIKKMLGNIIPSDMKFDRDRCLKLDSIVYKIENAGSEFYKIVDKNIANTIVGLHSYEDDDFRIRVIKQQELQIELENSGKTVKWGKYLRAPAIYFEILNEHKDKFIKLNDIAKVERGYTTGVNEFFYPSEDKIKFYEIDEEFLVPLLKSPKEFDSILIDPHELTTKVFLCNQSKIELRRNGKTGALNYIKWGEKQATKEGVPWSEVPTVKDRKPGWWSLSRGEMVQICWTAAYAEKFVQRYCNEKILIDKRHYRIIPKDEKYTKYLAAVLNSSLVSFFTEMMGRVNLGDGALDTTVEEVEEYIFIPNILSFDDSHTKQIEKAFEKLLSRPIEPIMKEVKLKDRQKLDKLVLEAIGIDPDKYLQPIYDGLLELVDERINLAKMRKTLKNSKAKKNVEKLKEQVMNEIIPDGPKIFPKHFVDSRYLQEKTSYGVNIPYPDKPLKIGSVFLGKYELVAEGYKYEAKSEDDAKYIIYSQRPWCFVTDVPNERSVVVNAVQDYERYLKRLREKLFETLFGRTLDHKLADNLTKQIFDDLGLPYVS